MKKLLTLLVILIGLAYFGNNAIEITEYTLTDSKWPAELDGYRIIHLSDLQSKSYGKNQKPLLEKIEMLKPDLIVFTGDLIDRRHYAKEPALELMKGCLDLAPTAYVTGNHEIWHGSAESLKEDLEELGILVLDNKSTYITQSRGTFKLTGIADRADFMGQQDYEMALKALVEPSLQGTFTSEAGSALPVTAPESDMFHILLSHRPEQFENYAEHEYNMVFSGHSHGGQIRLPFIGGLLAPDQGLLPEYDGGFYSLDASHMIVSRGLGNSIFPFRVLNRPEIPVLTLYSENTE